MKPPAQLVGTIALVVDADRQVFATVSGDSGTFVTGPWSTADACLERVARHVTGRDPLPLAHAVPGERSPHAQESLDATETDLA